MRILPFAMLLGTWTLHGCGKEEPGERKRPTEAVSCDPADVERITELVEAPCTKQIVSDMTHLLRFEPSVRTYKKRTTSSR